VDSSVAPTPGYPATFAVDHPERITNWKPLVQWLLAFPHYIVLYALSVVADVVALIAWFAIVFTGRMPEGLAGLLNLYVRYANRLFAYTVFLREEYPPFTFDTTAADPGDYPAVRTDLAPQLDDRNRLTVGFRFILVIPQFIVLAIVAFVGFFCTLIAVFVVLFTGHWPEGLREFVVGVTRWSTRVNAYALLLVDDYPPFSLD
jgi:hypothetical protein